MIKSLLVSLILTLIIELAVSFLLGIRRKGDFKVIALANVCTNPVVVYIINLVLIFNLRLIWVPVVVIMEVFACFAEYAIYEKHITSERITPLELSLMSNAVSFGTGVVLHYIR